MKYLVGQRLYSQYMYNRGMLNGSPHVHSVYIIGSYQWEVVSIVHQLYFQGIHRIKEVYILPVLQIPTGLFGISFCLHDDIDNILSFINKRFMCQTYVFIYPLQRHFAAHFSSKKYFLSSLLIKVISLKKNKKNSSSNSLIQ